MGSLTKTAAAKKSNQRFIVCTEKKNIEKNVAAIA